LLVESSEQDNVSYIASASAQSKNQIPFKKKYFVVASKETSVMKFIAYA